jgi:glycosidase
MPWGDDQDRDLLATYRRLIAVRRAGGSLWRADRETLVADDERGLLVVRLRDGERTAVVVLNLGATARSLALPELDALALVAMTDATVAHEGPNVSLGPFAGAILATGLDAGMGVG